MENESAFAVFDAFPVNPGHTLIISKRHIESFFELTEQEMTDSILLLNKAKEEVQKRFNPAGFNIGVNIGSSAGQTVPHVHVHLIPRYHGDVANPRGGVRGVIPGKKDY